MNLCGQDGDVIGVELRIVVSGSGGIKGKTTKFNKQHDSCERDGYLSTENNVTFKGRESLNFLFASKRFGRFLLEKFSDSII